MHRNNPDEMLPLFQLLDRDEKNASQYPVKPSEDIKAYLAKELGGEPDNYF